MYPSALSVIVLSALLTASATAAASDVPPTLASVLAAATKDDWRTPDPEQLLYLDLESGRVVIELAPAFAPNHVSNIKALVRAQYFDGLFIVRAQENYVVQWADPDSGDPDKARSTAGLPRQLKAEFARKIKGAPDFVALPDGDVYAAKVGLSDGFPVARDSKTGQTWLAHCYGMVGAGRDEAADSGSGTELYVVIGHAPRHLDRNVTLVGRVLKGMEHLNTLPRGTAAMGFYSEPGQRVPIRSIRVAADVAEDQRTQLDVFRTDTVLFKQLVQARRNRHESWFVEPTGKIELCNVPIPVRNRPIPAPAPAG